MKNLANLIRNIIYTFRLYKLLKYITNNKSIDHLACKLIPFPEKFNKGEIHRLFRNNQLSYCDLSDLMDWSFYFGILDPGTQFLSKKSKGIETFVDVGSNKGFLMLYLISNNKNIKKYFAFEANSKTYNWLEKHKKENNLEQVESYHGGIGSKSGYLYLRHRNHNNSGMDELSELPDSSTVKVEIRTLDSFIGKFENGVDLIKIDTEGHELKVLQGAEKIIQKFKPKLFIEIDKNNLLQHGNSIDELINWLQEHQFNINLVQTNKSILSVDDIKVEHGDIYCEQ